jgi:hypothetical protein
MTTEMLTNLTLIGVGVVLAAFLFQPRVMNAPGWRATITPLASIIGSGFLVAGPILVDSVGAMAPLAMAALCGVAYLYGSSIRYSITEIDGAGGALSGGLLTMERLADVVLSFAYFVSVAYYLNLFAAFGLRLFGVIEPGAIRGLATAAIAVTGILGAVGGLRALERLETVAVDLKLAVIGGLIAALAVASGTGAAPAPGPVEKAWSGHAFQVVLGLIILVQGFETSRYLGDEYDARTRVRTMRLAQAVSSVIYVAFIWFAAAYFSGGLSGSGSETAIIDMLKPIGAAVYPLLIAAALASQSSAAIADLNGAGGLIAEVSKHRIPVNLGYLVTAALAIAMTWSANIFEIITYASKAFVAYYGLQAALAAALAWERGRYGRAALYGAGIVLAVLVIAVAVPADV